MGLELFRPSTQSWFASTYGAPTPVEEEGWNAVALGRDVLVSAPTGTGKTLTAFLYWLDLLASEAEAGALPRGVSVIYLSPLKSLSNDIRENLEKPLAGLGISGIVRAAVRTGDTTSSERAKMRREPPHILVTTPESLYVLLTSASGREMIAPARCVIVDELHSILGSKRGTHLALSLERLDALHGSRLQRIALSATIQPLDLAADFLSGGRGAAVVAPKWNKKTDLSVDLPWPDFSRLPGPSVWPFAATLAYEYSRECRTTIAFTNGRAMAEKLAHAVNLAAEDATWARTHHGCVSKEQRLEAELALRQGNLRMLAATSSMELGIDVGDIDLVLQVSAPPGISQTLQRAGRAGHGPNRVSRMRVIALSEADALASILAARGAVEGRIERIRPPEDCGDVLAQHLASMAAAGDYTVDEALTIVRGAWPYRNIEKDEIEDALRMLAGDFEHRRELPVRPRVLYDRIHGKVKGDEYTRILALSSSGTIPDRGWYSVYTRDGKRLGELDEEFVFEAKLGDKFLLGAFAWRIDEITHDRVFVTPSSTEGAQTPFWRGDAVGRPVETGLFFGRLYGELEDAIRADRVDAAMAGFPASRDAKAAAAHFLRTQLDATGCLPTDRLLIVEHFTDNTGARQIMVHSVFGRQVNRALLMLLREQTIRETGGDVRGYEDDDGILLYPVGDTSLPDGLFRSLDPDTAAAHIKALLPGDPLFSMCFRYACSRALLMGAGRKGGRTPLWVQRMRGAEALSAAIPQGDHPLLREATREALSDYMDLGAAVHLLREIAAGRVAVREISTEKPSPMTIPLRRQAEAELMYDYAPVPAQVQAVAAARSATIAPAPDTLRQETSHADSPEALHSLLLREGDLAPGDTDAPAEWFLDLENESRAVYTEAGYWIAAEHEDEYRRGFTDGDEAATDHILRRTLRFRGALDETMLSQRYGIPREAVAASIGRLLAADAIRQVDGGYIHRDAYEFAQRATVRNLRREIRTAPPEALQSLLLSRLRVPGTGVEQVRRALATLSGTEATAEAWENQILPARVPHYRPTMLDEVLAEGEYVPLVRRDGKLKILFCESADLDGAYAEPCDALCAEDAAILDCLTRSGSQFAQFIARQTGIGDILPRLLRLCEAGLVRQDGFAPIRMLESGRVFASAGRWTRAGLPRALSTDEAIDRAARLCPVLSRETVASLPWSEAIRRLRILEFQGGVRRGYFVSALSGAQFVADRDFVDVTRALASPGQDCACLPANDPAQLYGRCLPHEAGREFLCVSGTTVIFRGGRVAAVLERGEELRIFDDFTPEAALALARDFSRGHIYPKKSRITIKKCPDEAQDALRQAGFVREALDYVLYRD